MTVPASHSVTRGLEATRRRFLVGAGVAVSLAGSSVANAAPADKKSQSKLAEVKAPYEVDGRQFEGVLVWNDKIARKRPILFIQPDWDGVSAEMITQAHELAGDRYIVLMADMFGVGTGSERRTVPELIQRMRSVHQNLAFTTSCSAKGYRTLLAEADKRGLVDHTKPKFAMGYCAGGGFLVEHARTGEDFDALVVLHITNPNPVVPGTPCNIRGRVMSIHGAADPITPKAMMTAFEEELTAAKVEWRAVLFGGAVHAFCIPSANSGPTRYDEKLCRTSYHLMHEFFAETEQLHKKT